MHDPSLILVAEDEPDTATLLSRICNRAGYQTVIARDGLSTVQEAGRLLPDLILLDIQLPYMDGFHVLETLRANPDTAHIPVIILTATAKQPEEVAKGIDTGADDYMLKPFNHHELLARMRAKIRARTLEDNLQKRTEELQNLVRLGVELNQPVEIEMLAERLLFFLVNEMRISAALLYVYPSDERPAALFRLRQGETVQTDLSADFLALDSQDSLHSLNAPMLRRIFEMPQLNSGVISPLLHHNHILGLLVVGHVQEKGFNDATRRVMMSIARQVSLAVRNVQLYTALRQYSDELELRVEERTQALKNAQEQLLRSEKLASLGRLAGEIAHEINNPLQPITVLLENAIEDLEAGQLVEIESLQVAMQEVRRIKELVQTLLNFARPDTRRIEDIDLRQLIRETLVIPRKLLEKQGVTVNTQLEAGLTIHGNPDQLRQVVVNLVINAIDAMSHRPDGLLDVRLWREGAYGHISIRDNGEGIAREDMKHIFEPFYTTKKDGSGLGLAISHSLIDAHGGQIDVQSEVGKGTEFVIKLPLKRG